MTKLRSLLPTILAGAVMGGILHILTVIGLPYVAEKDAWNRLSSELSANRLVLADEKGLALPFSSPDVVHAFCVLDLSRRNVVVTTPMLDPAWSVAVSTEHAENFYLITAADAKRNAIRLLIVPRERLAQEDSTERTDEGEEQDIVISPSVRGVVAIRAPLRGESFRARTLKALKEARCVEQLPLGSAVASAEEDAGTEFVELPTRRPAR
jgi:uncharacterized membrane protein